VTLAKTCHVNNLSKIAKFDRIRSNLISITKPVWFAMFQCCIVEWKNI